MTTPDQKPTDPIPLPGADRAIAAVVAVVAAIATALYVLVPRTTQTVAPQCTGGAECAVSVAAAVDSVIVVALIVLVALFALMAVTGMVWAPSFGEGPGVVLPLAHAAPVDFVPKDLPAQKLTIPAALPHQARSAALGDARTLSALALWNSLPMDRQSAAARFGGEHWGTSTQELQLAIRMVAHDADSPDDPYYAQFDIGGAEKVLRLARTR